MCYREQEGRISDVGEDGRGARLRKIQRHIGMCFQRMAYDVGALGILR